MLKKLVIAEKPSVARDIARVLKCGQSGEGYLYSDEYIVSWAIGHLVTLCDPDDYDPNLKRWIMDTLPIIPEVIRLKPISKTKKQFTVLSKLMNSKDVEYIICATDSGREGELIFRYVYEMTKCAKPFKRLWISSMTDTAITEGFRNIKDGAEYDNLYLSAKCRSESDWLVGINASRAYTIKYGTLLSIGRVQTPTLAIIVQKQKEIAEFVPKDYWEVLGTFTAMKNSETYQGTRIDSEGETKIFNEDEAKLIASKVKGKNGTVESVEKETVKQPPPLLYDLTELQRDCNKKFGFPAKKTLSIAQELYEKRKLITYPRTDSRHLSGDMVPKVRSALGRFSMEPYIAYVKKLDIHNLPVTKRVFDDSKVTDHHAIIPTDHSINLNITQDELKVYDLIARRFIAAFYPYHVFETTKLITVVENERFLSKGKSVVSLGYMELYADEMKKDEILPNLNRGDEITAVNAETLKKRTQPPLPYTEGTLLSAMENAGRFVEDEDLKEKLKESGLGTPATRAAIIERLIEVGYIIRKGKTLIPTDKGIKLIDIVPVEMKSAETTGKWEKGLGSISKGTMDNKKFMASIYRYVDYIINSAKMTETVVVFPQEKKNAAGKKSSPLPSLGKCPVCGQGDVFENSKGFYCGRWKSGCKYTVWKDKMAIAENETYADAIKKQLAAGKPEK